MEKVHLLHHREIKKSHNPLRNRRGVTVTELMVVLGMVGIVALGNASFIFDFTKQLKKINSSAEGESELSNLSIASVNILKKSSVSFNKLALLDDNKRNFFDYYPDVPFATLQSYQKGFESRTFTMSASNQNRFFYLLQSEESEYDSLVFDPMFAYAVSAAPANQMANGTISYAGLNSIPNLSGTSGPAKNGTMSQVFQSRWANGNYFLLSCPTYLRPVVNNVVNVMTVPRFASYLGKVSNSDLIPAAAMETKVGFMNSNPMTNADYTGVDNFLRNLPSVGGAAPFVKIEPVKLVRFEFRQNAATKKYELWYQEMIQGTYKDKNMLISDVNTVTFVRKAISLPLISMEVLR